MEGWDWESQCLEKVRERTENWRIQPSLSIIRLSQFRPWSNPPTVKAKLTDYYLMNHSSPEGGHLLTSAASFLLENCSEFVFQLLQCSLIASHDQTPHFQLETRTKKGYFSQSKEFCLSCVRTLCLEFASTLYIRHHNLCNGFCYFLFQPSTAHNIYLYFLLFDISHLMYAQLWPLSTAPSTWLQECWNNSHLNCSFETPWLQGNRH